MLARARKYVKPMLRLTAFFVCLMVGLLYLDYRAAEASVMDRMLGIGQRMAPYLDDGRGTEAPRQVRINGVRLFVAAGHTDHPPQFVRKWYTDRYAAKDDALAKVGEELKRRGAMPQSTPALNQMVFGSDQKGGVAALDFGDKLSLEGLKSRLNTFIGSGDLGSIAKLRYVYYEKTGAGGTRFLTVWTDEKFSLTKLVPGEKRDADGADIDGVPRYPGTVRALSAEERGMPQRIAVYEGPGSPETAEMFYRARMKTLGWECDETFAELAKKQHKTALKFGNRAGHEVVIDLSDAENGQGLTVAIMQTR
jgi:hypothetical protein